MDSSDQAKLRATAAIYVICGLITGFSGGLSVYWLLLAVYGVACLIWPELTHPNAEQLREIRVRARRKSAAQSASGLPWFVSGPVFAVALTLIVVVTGYLLRG